MATIRELVANIKINLVGANSRNINAVAKAVDNLSNKLKTLSKVDVGNLRKVALSAGVMRRGFGEGAKSFSTISSTMKNAAESSKKFNKEIGQMSGKFGVLGSSMETSVGRMRKFALASGLTSRRMEETGASVRRIKNDLPITTQGVHRLGNSYIYTSRNVGRLRNDVSGLTSGFRVSRTSVSNFSHELFSLGNILVTTGIVTATKSLIDLQTKLDSIRVTFKAVAGSAEAGNEEFKFAKDLALSLGQNYLVTTKGYSKFYAATKATLPVEQIREVFKTFQEASLVLGMSQYDIDLVNMALEQMASKGIVSMEELRRQLGERLFGAFEMASTSMGLTQMEFNDLIRSGQLLTSKFLVPFAAEVRKRFSSELPSALETTRYKLGALENAFIEFQRSVLEGGFGEAAGKAIEGLTEALKSKELITFMNGVGKLSLIIADNFEVISVLAAAAFAPKLIGVFMNLLTKLPLVFRKMIVEVALIRNLGGGILPILRVIGGTLLRVVGGPVGLLVLLFLPRIIKMVKEIINESSDAKHIFYVLALGAEAISNAFKTVYETISGTGKQTGIIAETISGIFDRIKLGIKTVLALFSPITIIMEEIFNLGEGKITLFHLGWGALLDFIRKSFIQSIAEIRMNTPAWILKLLKGGEIKTKIFLELVAPGIFGKEQKGPAIEAQKFNPTAFIAKWIHPLANLLLGNPMLSEIKRKKQAGELNFGLPQPKANTVNSNNKTSYGNVNININIPQGQDPKTMDKAITNGIRGGLPGINFKKSILETAGGIG